MVKSMSKLPKSTRAAAVLTALTSSLLAPTMVSALALEEVVVTAQKRQESMQDVPVTLSAFTDQAMKDMGISNAQDLQLATPGLVFTSLGNLGAPYLRGVGTRFTLNGLDASVATYVGDRYVPRGGANMMELGIDVERVEVLKGPQGILYGRNATGGAIRVIKKGAAEELEGEVRATVGNYSLKEVAASISAPISESLGFRLSAQKTDRDGWQDNLTSDLPGAYDKVNDKNAMSMSGVLEWAASDNTQIDVGFDYWEVDDSRGQDGAGQGPSELNVGVANFGGVFPVDRETVATETRQKNDGDQLSADISVEHSMDAIDLVSVTIYSRFDMRWTSEGDGSSAELFGPAIAYDESETWSQEFRIASNGDGAIDWTAGVFFYDDSHGTDFNFFSAILPGISQGQQTTETTAWAVFAHGGYDLSERWGVKFGARYSYEEREVDLEQSPRDVTSVTPVPQKFENDWNEFTPMATLEYRADAGLVYLTYSRGFKSGGYNYPAPTTADGLDPEILDMIELGFKGDLLDDTLRLNAAVFHYDYTDLQVQRAAGDTGLTKTENAADATILGLDLDVTWLLTDALTLRFGLSLLDSEYDDYDATEKVFRANLDGSYGTATPTPGMTDVRYDASGESLLRAADYQYFVTANYEFALNSGARLPLSLTYSYTDDVQFDFSTDPIAKGYLRQEGYGLLSARASYHSADDNWSVSLWGRNLTDEEYFNEIAGNGMGLRGFWAEPRTYGADVSVKF